MSLTFTVPQYYGFVVLGAGVLPFVTNMVVSGPVMAARKRLDVKLPNLYATPGFHKHHEEFNRIQRSHQNMLETVDQIAIMTLLGGLKHPIVATIGIVCYCLGCYYYAKGYSDMSLEVSTARYKKGGMVKVAGFLLPFVCTCSFAFSLIMG